MLADITIALLVSVAILLSRPHQPSSIRRTFKRAIAIRGSCRLGNFPLNADRPLILLWIVPRAKADSFTVDVDSLEYVN